MNADPKPWLPVVCLPLLLLGGAVRGQDAEATRPRLVIEEARRMETATETSKFWVRGSAAGIPDDVRLRVSLVYYGQTGLEEKCAVQGGRFDLFLGATTGRILAGEYRVQVRYAARDQGLQLARSLPPDFEPEPGVFDVVVGTPEEAEADRMAVRDRVRSSMRLLERVYGALGQWTTYHTSAAKLLLVTNNGKVPEEDARRLERAFLVFEEEIWEGLYTGARHDWQDFGREVYLSPFPKATDAVQDVLSHLDLWHAEAALEFFSIIGRKAPADIRDPGPFEVPTLRRNVEVRAADAYRALEIEAPAWQLVDGATREQGEINGDHYRSTVAKFEVAKPGSEWGFDFTAISPLVRLRIRPEDPDLDGRVMIGVEVKDFPLAENYEDLTRDFVILTQGRWAGFKKISGKTIRVSDATMPEGIRHGYRMELTTQQGDTEYRVLDYELYCRWHKRTYGLVCLGRTEDWETFAPVFEETTKTFHVLDAPPPEDGGGGGK